MKIFQAIENLIYYGIKNLLINKEDEIFIRNKLLDILKLEEFQKCKANENINIEDILKDILDYACEKNLINNSVIERDLFDTKIMGVLLDRPSNICREFFRRYEKDPKDATSYYYNLNKVCNYIRVYRVEKDIKWKTYTKYGDLDITINLSKPEKDPKDIERLKNMKSISYPKCLLCKENEGYNGRLDHPSRENLRIIPININNSKWFFQYSPYVYYNEHCIVFTNDHVPMKIDENTFKRLLDFVELFPHYFIGSNADLPIVGGSILSHDHFQGGRYEFSMEKAKIEREFYIDGFEDVKLGIVNWPMSVIRLSGTAKNRIVRLGNKILLNWRNYTDKERFIFSHTDNIMHNTITPIARKVNHEFQLDLVLRNNITTKEHPFGVYHPHEELHHIKKENIGLIEVMGLAILPPRLKYELELLKDYIISGKNIDENNVISKHSNWVKSFINNYNHLSNQNIDLILKEEVGKVFLKVLEHAGVFKRDKFGQKGFEMFINSLN